MLCDRIRNSQHDFGLGLHLLDDEAFGQLNTARLIHRNPNSIPRVGLRASMLAQIEVLIVECVN
jgi:hypothetical protein